MAMQKFRAPQLPLPPKEFSSLYLNQLTRSLSLYFSQLDSKTPLEIDGLTLSNLSASAYNLPIGAVYRDGRDLKIVLEGDYGVVGVPATASLGTVSVTTA